MGAQTAWQRQAANPGCSTHTLTRYHFSTNVGKCWREGRGLRLTEKLATILKLGKSNSSRFSLRTPNWL